MDRIVYDGINFFLSQDFSQLFQGQGWILNHQPNFGFGDENQWHRCFVGPAPVVLMWTPSVVILGALGMRFFAEKSHEEISRSLDQDPEYTWSHHFSSGHQHRRVETGWHGNIKRGWVSTWYVENPTTNHSEWRFIFGLTTWCCFWESSSSYTCNTS